MNSITAPLTRSLAIEYYRSNSGFFLLIGTLTFGFMSKVEHVALAQVLTSSPYTLSICAGVWVIYSLKIVSFNHRRLNQSENLVLFTFELLPLYQRIVSATLVFALQFLPALAYGLFLIAQVPPASYQNIWIIGALLAGCLVGGVTTLVRSFTLPFPENETSALQRFLDRRLHKPFAQFYLEGLLRTDLAMVLGTKIFSGGLLFGVSALYRAESYDNRLIGMALTTCAMANLLLVFRLHEFEHTAIAWNKNLPIPLTTRYLTFVLVITILLLPEWAVLLRFFPAQLSPGLMAADALYLLATDSFLLGLLQTMPGAPEDFIKKTFWMFMAFIVLILFKAPVILLALATATAGYILFRRNYYLFEPGR